jgi:hypothetical protein
MNPGSKRFLHENSLGISLTFIGLLFAAAVVVFYLSHGSYPHRHWRKASR